MAGETSATIGTPQAGGDFDITLLPGVKVAYRHDLGALKSGDLPAGVGDIITKWQDQSGNGNDATGASGPKYQTNALDFGHIANRVLTLPTIAMPADGIFTIIQRLTYKTQTTYAYPYGLHKTASTYSGILLWATGGQRLVFFNGENSVDYVNPAVNGTVYTLSNIHRNPGNDMELFVGGSVVYTGDPVGRAAIDAAWGLDAMGLKLDDASKGLSSDMEGFILCHGALSETDRLAAEAWLVATE